MDSEPNTYKHGRFMSAGVYISAACLKTQQRAELDTALVSQFASASVQRGKRKKEERLCDAFRLYQNILTTFDKSGIVQTPVLASIQLWKEEGSEKNLIKFISGSLASQLVSWTAAVVKSPRWPRQARSRINKKYLIKALPRNTILLKLRPYYQKKTNRDWSKVIKIKRGESMGLESSTKRPTLKRRWRNIRPKQSWHWLFAAVKT